MLLLPIGLLGQDQKIVDSLKSAIEVADHDTSVCNAYSALGELVYVQDLDSALVLFLIGQDLAEKNLQSSPSLILTKKYLTIIANASNNIGAIYYNKGEILIGLSYFKKSLDRQEELGNKIGISYSLNNLGALYYSQGDIKSALDYYDRSVSIAKERGDSAGIANSFNNLGILYKDQEDYEKALEYCYLSLEISQKMNDQNLTAITMTNLGAIYTHQGNIEKVNEFYSKSIKIYQEVGNTKGIAYCLNNIGASYENEGDPENAIKNYRKGLKLWEELGDMQGIALACSNIGDLVLAQGNIEEAAKYAVRSYEIAIELGYPLLIREAAKLLKEVHRRNGDFKLALEMSELFVRMRDSINNQETQKATIRLQTKYEFEKVQLVKEQEEKESARLLAEETGRRDNLQYSVILIALLILFGGVLSLGFMKASPKMAEGIIFFSFLILFEFLLVLADPYIENWTGGAPGMKLLFNAGIAALIFPAHAFFESNLKSSLAKNKT